jgi:hypothetical protein
MLDEHGIWDGMSHLAYTVDSELANFAWLGDGLLFLLRIGRGKAQGAVLAFVIIPAHLQLAIARKLLSVC